MPSRLLPITQHTDLVSYEIRIEGENMPQQAPLFSIETCLEANRIGRASLCFSDGDATTGEWLLSSGDQFVPGTEIEILAGYHSETALIFQGIVTQQRIMARGGRLELEVECHTKSVQMTAVRQAREFADQTDADAMQSILDEYELAGEIEATDVTHETLVQYDCTDWDFILSRAESNGCVVLPAEDKLAIKKPLTEGEAVATLQLGANIIELDAEIDSRKQVGVAEATSWDAAEQDVLTTSAPEPEWTEVGNFEPEALAEAVGASSVMLRHAGSLPEEELLAWSHNKTLRSRIAHIRGRIRVQGFHLNPGELVELAGLGERFNGLAWVGGVRHEIGQGNWITDIQIGLDCTTLAERLTTPAPSAAGLVSPASGLQVGIVTEIDGDPAGAARVRVRLPMVGAETEGVWARLATLDAGDGRGSFFYPEIDDEVVIGFLNEDPRYPIVLGMMHSGAAAPPLDPIADNPQKGFFTRSGIKLLFDDEKTVVTLETPGGNSLTLDDENGKIKMADQNGNAIELTSSGITLNAAGTLTLSASSDIKMESQVNLEAKAGAQLKLEGTAGAEMQSSGVTVIKGSLVQIN